MTYVQVLVHSLAREITCRAVSAGCSAGTDGVYLLLFFAAMLAVEITGLGTRYARISRVLGGSVLLIIGGMMILKPDWLM